jgi:hypothetical protein
VFWEGSHATVSYRIFSHQTKGKLLGVVFGPQLFAQRIFGRIQLSARPQQEYLIPLLQFFIRAGIDNVSLAAFNANDAVSRRRLQR